MSEHGFDTDILDVSSTLKRGKSYIISSGGKIIAALTLLIAVLVTFTDITFSGAASYAFFTNLIMMLIASYLMFFSLEDAGERLGEETEPFTEAARRYRAAKEKIDASSISALRDFCRRYSEKELEYRRESLLTEYGYTKDEYLEYAKSGACPDRRSRRIFKKYERMSSVALTPQVLLSSERVSCSSELINPERYKLLRLIIKLIPSTLCMAFTVSVMLSAKDGMTLDSVLDGLLKLSALPIVGLRGYSEGYSYAKNSKSSWLESKARIIETFLLEQE